MVHWHSGCTTILHLWSLKPQLLSIWQKVNDLSELGVCSIRVIKQRKHACNYTQWMHASQYIQSNCTYSSDWTLFWKMVHRESRFLLNHEIMGNGCPLNPEKIFYQTPWITDLPSLNTHIIKYFKYLLLRVFPMHNRRLWQSATYCSVQASALPIYSRTWMVYLSISN